MFEFGQKDADLNDILYYYSFSILNKIYNFVNTKKKEI
jgi:hypothetical protein